MDDLDTALQDVVSISQSMGGLDEKPVLSISLNMADGSRKQYHMMEANAAFKWLQENKPDVIEAWKQRIGA